MQKISSYDKNLKIIRQNFYSFLLLLIIITGCTKPRFVLDSGKVHFKDLLDNIHTEQQMLKSLTGNARISVETEEFSGNFFATIYYLKSDSILIAVSGPFGIQAGSLFIGKERFIFYNQINNQFYNGSVKDFENKNFFQFPLKLSELINIFTASDKMSSMKIQNYDIRDDLFFINAHNGILTQNIWISNTTGHITKIEMLKNNEIQISKTYEDFIIQDEIYFPRKIKFIRPQQKQAVSIFYSSLSINTELDRENFVIKIADGAKQIDFSYHNIN